MAYKVWVCGCQAPAPAENGFASSIHLSNNDFVMSVSTSEVGQAWHEVQRLVPDELIAPNGLAPGSGLSRITQSGLVALPPRLRGHLEIPGVAFTIPEQEFSARFTEGGILLESHPEHSWPKILIDLLPEGDVKNFAIGPSDNTVRGELLRTRVVFFMGAAKTWFFHLNDSILQGQRKTEHRSETDETELLYRAKIYRKLTYLEEYFDLRFLLPATISSEEVQRIETIFRGITEGEFRGRATAMSFKLLPSMIDLSKPPFSGIGEFSYEVEAPVKLFDQQVPAGRITVHLEKTELASPRVAEHIRKGSTEPIEVRFEVLDNQVVYRFEDYVRQSRQNLRQQLDQFKQGIALEEPQELVDLVDEPLQSDVSKLEASQIAMGWTFYSNLPDRYCPQDPEIDQSTGHWRVPIWLVYANGEGGHVGDLLIHKKTAVILSHTSIEELRSKAMALAETMLHAG
ncbi:MAG: hypothetical protein AABN34_06130 [Acidobacteriota bacterium]